MAKTYNYEISISDPKYDKPGSWSILDFGVGRRVKVEDWKKRNNGDADKSTDGLRKMLAANKNLVSIAIDNINLKDPMWANFPKFVPGVFYDRVLVRIKQFMMDTVYKGPHIDGLNAGHNSVGADYGELVPVDNFSRGVITLYHLKVLQTKLLTIPAGVFSGGGGGVFSSVLCKVEAASRI